MAERPILFQGAMVRALLAGTKTQTRRAWREQPPAGVRVAYVPGETRCPYGQPGDRLWVKETFRFTSDFDGDSPTRVAERCLDAGYRTPWAPIQYEADGTRRNWQHVGTPPHEGPPQPGKTRVSIHMPRWACRLVLDVTEVRVERLQDISEADAIAEGIAEFFRGPERLAKPALTDAMVLEAVKGLLGSARAGYRDLWESINGAGSWDANPWVWAVSFRKLTQ